MSVHMRLTDDKTDGTSPEHCRDRRTVNKSLTLSRTFNESHTHNGNACAFAFYSLGLGCRCVNVGCCDCEMGSTRAHWFDQMWQMFWIENHENTESRGATRENSHITHISVTKLLFFFFVTFMVTANAEVTNRRKSAIEFMGARGAFPTRKKCCDERRTWKHTSSIGARVRHDSWLTDKRSHSLEIVATCPVSDWWWRSSLKIFSFSFVRFEKKSVKHSIGRH